MEFPTLINSTSLYLFQGLYRGILLFYLNFKRSFCKETVGNLIRRRVLHCLLMFHKKDDMLIWIESIRKKNVSLWMLSNVLCFCRLWILFLQNYCFLKCQTVWIHIRPDVLSRLICVKLFARVTCISGRQKLSLVDNKLARCL